MFKNYIKIALRNFRKQKSYSFFNILSLAVGMAAFILIALYVQYELSFDKYYENSESIYRILTDHGNDNLEAATPGPLAPNYPFEYNFFDEEFDHAYRAEQKLSDIFSMFSVVAILLACMGLLGLASFTAEQRTKEIGIRKVLGASVSGIIILLSKEFARWVLVANIIAWPIAYYAMDKWLQGFAYRTSVNSAIFLLAGFCTFTLALLTVSYQTTKAASANLVDSLKYE